MFYLYTNQRSLFIYINIYGTTYCFARISDVYDVYECSRCYVIIYNAIKVTVITGMTASLYIKCVILRI